MMQGRSKKDHPEPGGPARIGEHDILDLMHGGEKIGTAQRGAGRFEVLFRGVTLKRRKLQAPKPIAANRTPNVKRKRSRRTR
jgi:hypothetical protein